MVACRLEDLQDLRRALPGDANVRFCEPPRTRRLRRASRTSSQGADGYGEQENSPKPHEHSLGDRPPRCPFGGSISLPGRLSPEAPLSTQNVALAGLHKTVLTVVAVGSNVESNPYNLLVGGSGCRTLQAPR